jgi:hypothetical protein
LLALGGTVLHCMGFFSDNVRVQELLRQLFDILPPQDKLMFFFFCRSPLLNLGSVARLVSCESQITADRRWRGAIGSPPDGQIGILFHTLHTFSFGQLYPLSLAPQGRASYLQSSNKKKYSGVAVRQMSVVHPMPSQWPALIKLALSSTNFNLHTFQTLDDLYCSSYCRHVRHITHELALSAVVCASSAISACSAFDSASRQGDSSLPSPRSS